MTSAIPARTPAAPERLTLVLLLALALALRLIGLAHESVWIDEAFTVNLARLPAAAIPAFEMNDVHPPLYALLMRAWIGAFGASEFSIRLPSVVFGALTVLLLHRLGSRLFGRPVGRLAALLAATSVFAIHYSQEARNYSLMALLTVASMDRYIAGLAGWNARRVLGYLAASTALVYTHHFGWFAILAQDAHALAIAFDPPRRGWFARWIGIQLALALAFAPWAGVLAHQIAHATNAFWASPPTALTLAKLAWEYAGSAPLLAIDLVLIAFAVWPDSRGAPARGGVATHGAPVPRGGPAEADARRAEAPHHGAARAVPRPLTLIILWVALPVLVPFTLARLGFGIFLTRMTLGSGFATLLLAAIGLARVPARALAIAALLLLDAFALLRYYRDVHKEPWRPAVAAIEGWAHPGDLVMVHAGYNLRTSYRYYATRRDLSLLSVDAAGAPLAPSLANALRDSVAHHERVWLVLSRSGETGPALRTLIGRDDQAVSDSVWRIRSYEPSRAPFFNGIEVIGYRRPGAAR
jgi:4-amino-4-deoxy-L-arabinose transferase-like glycosyltransferase